MKEKNKLLGQVIEIDETEIAFKPVSSANWTDLETLFSESGVQNGCWCMYWRIPRTEFQANYGKGNKQSLKKISQAGVVPGILAYHGTKPVGWCSVAPRTDFSVLGRSPTLKPVDEKPVWSIVCFYVSRPYRHGGMSRLLIQAAIQYAKENGARILEAYPIDPHAKSIEYERYTGLTTTFAKAGFKEVIRRSERRPVMRYIIDENNGEDSGMSANSPKKEQI
jgi:GNAT superfamily N-acetyltransferase